LIKYIRRIPYIEWRKIMTTEVKYSVISPEAERQVMAPGSFPPGMGGPPSGAGRPPQGSGGPPPGIPRPAHPLLSFSKRLDTLENKTIYMVDIGFGGGYNFMVQLQKWFTENLPSVTTIVRRKPGHVFADDSPELWNEVKEKGDAVILGVAG
jgi:hypothetical protein